MNESTLDMVSKHVDIEDIYVTRTIEQSDKSLDEIIKKGYKLLLCGGGDGTVMRIIEQIQLKVRALNKGGKKFKAPRFGILKLGTGNGWAGMLDTPPGVEPIWYVRQKKEKDLKYTPFNMIESEGRLFHFGGFGVDALIINDYLNFKANYKDSESFMWKATNGLAGYLMSLTSKTFPTLFLKGFKVDIKVTNLSDEPLYTASVSKGVVEAAYKKDDILYEGPADAVVFGTTTDFGFKMKVMPFATAKPGYFTVRISNVGAPILLPQLHKLWNGTIEHPRMYDFLVKNIRIEVNSDAPFQLGGDPEGYRNSVDLTVSDFAPELLDFRK